GHPYRKEHGELPIRLDVVMLAVTDAEYSSYESQRHLPRDLPNCERSWPPIRAAPPIRSESCCEIWLASPSLSSYQGRDQMKRLLKIPARDRRCSIAAKVLRGAVELPVSEIRLLSAAT